METNKTEIDEENKIITNFRSFLLAALHKVLSVLTVLHLKDITQAQQNSLPF